MSEKKISIPVQRIINRSGIRSECAPAFDGYGVCSSPSVIEELRKWLQMPANVPATKVVAEAKAKMGCDTEVCLYKSPYITSPEELDERFKPEGPWNSTEWLSNVNIDQILNMWRSKFRKMYHIPFQMIDFYDYGNELSNINWTRIAPEYDQVCCVINTDVKGGPGKHWVCIYVDLIGGTVEYFDSAGQETPPSITRFMTETSIELSRLTGKKYKDVNVTSMQHQTKDSECGVYCLFYLLARMTGVPYRFFEHTRVPDSDMQLFREFLFRH